MKFSNISFALFSACMLAGSVIPSVSTMAATGQSTTAIAQQAKQRTLLTKTELITQLANNEHISLDDAAKKLFPNINLHARSSIDDGVARYTVVSVALDASHRIVQAALNLVGYLSPSSHISLSRHS